MPSTYTFDSHASSGSPSWIISYTVNGPATMTATIDDGLISVGDEVSFSHPTVPVIFNGQLADAGITGQTAYYLGTGVFNGQTGYLFGNAPTIAGNTEFFAVFDSAIDDTTGSAFKAWSDNTASQSLGSTALVACFLEGTLIETPDGARQVETLGTGDVIVTQGGATTAVKWIGRQTIMPRFGPAERHMPVRFVTGSLGNSIPHTDLTVTADHGMLVEGVICHAGALVNGTTITLVPLAEMGESFTVYHIETETHEIILANGAPAETFIDNVSRRVFDNYAEFEALYGNVAEMEELHYPRAMSARQVPGRILGRLTACIAS
jgi:hypothetical protein